MNRELKREKYESLKHFDFSECESLIMASIKESNLDSKQILSHKVAIAALALLFKQIRNNAALIDFVDKNICDETTRSFLKKIANKFNNLIEELSRKFSDDVLQALTLYVEPRLFSEVSEYATPVGISKLAIRLLELKENDILLDMGSGVNSFLIEAALDNECKAFYGVEINTDNVVIGNIRTFILNLPIKIIQGNILSQDHAHLKANKVFSNHPLGLRLRDVDDFLNKNQRLNKYFKHAKRTISTDWVFTMAAYLNMDRPGKTIVLMSNAGTWNKPDEGLRKLLVEEGVVEGIVLLPARLMSSTAMSLTMMILSDNNKTVKMVDASEIYTEGRRQNSLEEQDISRIVNAYFNDSQISKGVTVEEIANNDYILNPQRYIGLELGFDNRITLAEVSASINRGVMITSNELDEIATKEETNYRYLMLGNINDGVIDSRLPCLTHIDEKYKKYCIKDGNLIISKNSPFKVALASVDEDEHILAAGNLYFIELDETRVNPVFVSVFMQSEAGMAQLHRFAKGGILKSISIQDLKKIEIPNIPREQQDRIAEEYLQLKDQLNVLQRQMDLVRDRMDRILEGGAVMHITQEELFDLIAAASSRLYTEMKLAYQSGRLKGYLASIGMVDLFPEEEERPLYDTYPDGKILIVGDSRIKPNEIYGCVKEYGIDNERIELRLGYEEAVNYPFRKLQYNPNYRLVLFGPIPHSVSRKGDKPSIIAHLENNDGYPKVIRLTDTNGQLKITKSNLKEAIWREIESGYLAV